MQVPRVRTALLLASSLLAFPLGNALAQGWRGHGGAFAIMRQLDLTSAQQEQIHSIMQSSRAASATTRTSLTAVDAQIHAAMFSTGDVSASQLEALMQQREGYQATLDQARVSTIVSVRGVLTASQLATASSLDAKLTALHAQEHALISGGEAPGATP